MKAMNIFIHNKSKGANLSMEIVFVWTLLAVRIFGAFIFVNCTAIFLPSEYSDVLSMLWAYTLYAPFEGALSVVCIWLCISKMHGFSFKTDKKIAKKFLFILLPLMMGGVYSLYWAFNIYPSLVRVQYMYFHNTERKLETATYLKFIEPFFKLQSEVLKNGGISVNPQDEN